MASRLIDSPYLDLASLACLGPVGYSLLRAQAAANAASADPDGTRNDHLTVANWAWIALGCVFWLLVIAGLLVRDEAALIE